MADSKKITGGDVIEKDFLKNSIANAEKFLDVILKTEKAVISLNKETTKELAQNKKAESASEIKKQNELLDKSAKQRKLLAEVKKLEAEATLAVTKAKAAEANQEKKTQAEKAKTLKQIEQENSLYFQQSKRLNDLRKQYKELALSGKGAEKETQALKKEIQDLDKQLKEVDADVGQFQRNVGDYKNQVKAALEETDLFAAGLSKLDNNTKAIIAGFGGVVEQLKKVKQAEDVADSGASKLGKTLKATGIAIFIAAIASLFSFFTSSREGALKFDLALNKLKATLDVILGSLSQIGKGLSLLGESFIAFFTGDFSDASDLAKEGIDSIKKSFDGNVAAIQEQIKGYDELTKAIFEYEDQLRLLQVTLAKVKMDEEDYNEIQADTTISLNEQKAALNNAINARLEAAQISDKIARKELELAGMQLELELRKNKVSEADIELLRKQGFENISASKLSIKASNDTINAVQEKYLAQLAAADALDDLDRQESERRRQIAQTEIINQVELIRSKKLGADAQVQILTKQVADEKVQLEEREKLNDQLRQKQLDAQAEEVKALAKLKTSRGQQAVSEKEIYDLINTQDAVLLANKLKYLRDTRLSEEAVTELAKVVNEAQTNELANQDRIAKFEEEKIERLAKIKQIDQEIAIIQQQTQQQALNELANQKAEQEKAANDLIFQSQNLFNRKIFSAAQMASEERIALIREEARIRQELLDKQYQIEKDNIEKNVNDEKIRAKELEKLAVKYNQDSIKIVTETENSIDQVKKNRDEVNKQRIIAQTNLVVTEIGKASAAFTDALDERYQQQSNRQQLQIDKTNANIQKQQDLAARGQANQLAFEEARLAEQQLAQQDAAKRQAKITEQIQTAEALLNAYNSELNQPGANPATAGARAIADVLLFKGIAKGIVQFAADGNDDVQGPGTTKSDSIPFMLSKHEGVVKAESNMGNPGVVKALNDGTFKDLYVPKMQVSQNDTASNIYNSILMQTNKEVIDLLTEIKNKPVQHVSVDELGNLIEIVYQNGVKSIIKHQSKRPKLG